MPFLLLQNMNNLSTTVTASGRLLSDPDFSRAWRSDGRRPQVTGTMEGDVCVVRCSNTAVRIALNRIPLDEAACPVSRSAETMANLFGSVGIPAPQYPYPVDFEERFFIPADAIVCTLEDGTVLDCEGKFDATDNTVRIDAVDQENFAWFYVDAHFAVGAN